MYRIQPLEYLNRKLKICKLSAEEIISLLAASTTQDPIPIRSGIYAYTGEQLTRACDYMLDYCSKSYETPLFWIVYNACDDTQVFPISNAYELISEINFNDDEFLPTECTI